MTSLSKVIEFRQEKVKISHCGTFRLDFLIITLKYRWKMIQIKCITVFNIGIESTNLVPDPWNPNKNPQEMETTGAADRKTLTKTEKRNPKIAYQISKMSQFGQPVF